MAGAGLVAIKRRIKSVTSTQKITNAMGLIATANLRKVRKKLDANDKYCELFTSVVNEFVSEAEGRNIYIHGNGSKKKLYICLNSDTGLCGGFNNSVVTGLDAKMSKDRENSILISVGQKGRMYFKRLHYKTEAEYVDIPDIPTMKEANTIVYKALDFYKNGEVGEINIAYTKFVSTVRQNVIVEKLLPLEANKETKRVSVKFEPSAEYMIDDVVLSHLKQKLLNCMMNSKASEQASRMTAMDGSTKNANDLLESLNLKYNRERQTAITQEITEIVGGAEALK
ncbi:F0F1 ATP synthase subunit gamma [Clostridium tyrobutyricum]|jgi:F-type H+-transporting ATPase subunit gamma|uniref:ATP synthase gamma chain n=1 Tax=Clostridium tyrobutyricum DIVETGP TaxID=1408889 RepID=W6N3M8_CLOTY|nr:ATP synthase F1 subunit gamma [Clostridium tyrobutyricum]AND83422.1 ATP synthase subunit gamma [Clostridium tyrobutyricum]ANP68221.1 F0F1 ATP synthase subunit gamma [Clostridium tyrobutyricum]MBR9647756.1 F0F1 ATP synthase subunit gamma [Clostridium tyrobutyricum]MBV4416270.1 F0F1 ATP synthase subunit gamma [Clostridium tyrobutyricum]MBV4421518.1 F0F1 ATP synthase subunit gamma [Clostridium tyrobutyricum]